MSRAVAVRPGRAARAGRASVRSTARSALLNYLKQSERPLQSLVFLLPLILIYEIGWRFARTRLLAFLLLRQFFALFGANASFLPALLLVGILLTWHFLSRDKWKIHVNTIVGMYLESVLLALPLLALAAAVARWQLRPLLGAFENGFPDQVIIAMGAGIYEEMIFRLIALTLLNILIVDILRIPKNRGAILMVLISGAMFSFYHYLGPEKFVWTTCLFRTIAGIYFGAIFLSRGFGVTAGCHAVYDMIVCAAIGIG
jgi:membrane protease YdiL (CAAX protease family)